MRILMALALVFSLSACAGVDQSLYDLSNTLAPADRVTGQRSLNMTGRESQIANSNKKTEALLQSEYIAKGRPINAKVNAADYARLQRVFGRVHAVSHMASEQWTAYLLPDDQWNAFTAGGSEIFVFKGLMDDVQSDDELAAIIGHEIAHVAANHVYERQAYTLANKLGGSKSAGRQSFQAAFTISDEEEADRIGILYATLAGYDPYAAARLWKRMYDNSGDFSLAIIDHPVNSHRYQAATQLAQEYAQHYMKGQVNPNHAAILQSYGSGGMAGNLQPGQGAGLAALLETAADVYGKKTTAKQQEMAQAQTRAFSQYVTKNLQIMNRGVSGGNAFHVQFKYMGTTPVANLNLAAQAGEELATYRVPDVVVMPGAEGIAQFTFKKARLNSGNINDILVAVVHAEPR